MKSRIPFYVLLGGLAVLSVAMLLPLLVPVMLAVIVGYLLTPVFDHMAHRIPSRNLRAAMLVLLVLVVLAVPGLLIVMQVGDEIPGALRSLDLGDAAEKVNSWLDSTVGRHIPLRENLTVYLARVREAALQRAPTIIGKVGTTALGLFIMLYTLFYVLTDGRQAWNNFTDILPLEDEVKPLLITNIQQTVSGVLYGQVITALIQGSLAGLGYLVFRIPHALFWTFITLITAMVPFVGTAVVWAPLAIWRLSVGDKFGGIGLLIYGGVLVMNIDNVVKPRLIAGRSQLHPVAALLGVFGGIQLFGVIGFVLGPVLLGLVVAMLSFHRNVIQRQGLLLNSGSPAGPPR